MTINHGFDPVLAAESASENSGAALRARMEGEADAGGVRKRRGSKESSLSPEQVRRQGDVTRIAFVALGQARAIAFLNGHHDALGGRPLDVAIESAAGFDKVETLIREQAESRS